MSRLLGKVEPNRRDLLWLGQVFVVIYLLVYSVSNMLNGNFLYSREGVSFLPPGMHWFSVAIFVLVFLGYILMDRRVNLLLIVPIGLVYYCLHEAIFNALFIPYNGLRDPVGVALVWYQLLAIVFVVTLVFIPIVYIFRNRILRFTKSVMWKKIAIVSWVALAALFAVRIAVGFPVSINVYDLATGVSTNPLVSNGFELATNIVFAAAFFSTFDFAFRKKAIDPNKTAEDKAIAAGLEQEKVLGQSSDLPLRSFALGRGDAASRPHVIGRDDG